VVNFFQFIVQNSGEVMAELGYRTVNEMIGQTAFGNAGK
jgi:glutamate synthase (NADPH/NADH) large chain